MVLSPMLNRCGLSAAHARFLHRGCAGVLAPEAAAEVKLTNGWSGSDAVNRRHRKSLPSAGRPVATGQRLQAGHVAQHQVVAVHVDQALAHHAAQRA